MITRVSRASYHLESTVVDGSQFLEAVGLIPDLPTLQFWKRDRRTGVGWLLHTCSH
jgi:hypothetical protein